MRMLEVPPDGDFSIHVGQKWQPHPTAENKSEEQTKVKQEHEGDKTHLHHKNLLDCHKQFIQIQQYSHLKKMP